MVEISENDIVELVRDIRRSMGNCDEEFATSQLTQARIFGSFILNGSDFD